MFELPVVAGVGVIAKSRSSPEKQPPGRRASGGEKLAEWEIKAPRERGWKRPDPPSCKRRAGTYRAYRTGIGSAHDRRAF